MTNDKGDHPTKKRRIWVRCVVSLVAVAVIAFLVYVWLGVHPSLEATKMATDFFARLAWPIVLFVFLLLFRAPLVALVRDLAKFKLTAAGMSFEGETTRTYDDKTAARLASDLTDSLPADESQGPEVGDGPPVDSPTEAAGDMQMALVDADPNMAMLASFIALERDARMYFADFVPADGTDARRLSLGRIIRSLSPKTQKLFTYLNRVRNGIAHGEAPRYTREDAINYQRQCEVVRRALGDRDQWEN